MKALDDYRPSADTARLLAQLRYEGMNLFDLTARDYYESLDWRLPESLLEFYGKYEEEIITIKRRLDIGYSQSLGMALWIARSGFGE